MTSFQEVRAQAREEASLRIPWDCRPVVIEPVMGEQRAIWKWRDDQGRDCYYSLPEMCFEVVEEFGGARYPIPTVEIPQDDEPASIFTHTRRLTDDELLDRRLFRSDQYERYNNPRHNLALRDAQASWKSDDLAAVSEAIRSIIETIREAQGGPDVQGTTQHQGD